jgi:hypothetical protein
LLTTCIQQIGSPSGNSYFLLTRPEPSDSPPNEAAPGIGTQTTAHESLDSTGQQNDFLESAVNISGTEYGAEDVSLVDISPQQVEKVVDLSLGLPRLTTGRNLYMILLFCALILLWK